MADAETNCARTDKSQSFADKVTAVERLLADDGKGGGDGKDKVA